MGGLVGNRERTPQCTRAGGHIHALIKLWASAFTEDGILFAMDHGKLMNTANRQQIAAGLRLSSRP